MDTRIYETGFEDGSTHDLSTNTIIENIYESVDDTGHHFTLLKSIVDIRKDSNAIEMEDGMIISKNGIKKRVITTKGWDVKVDWVDGGQSWVPMKDAKASNPVELAEFAISRKVHKEPAFAWWIPTVMKKKQRIVSKVKNNRRHRKTMKFGVKIPMNLDEALRFDEMNGNDLWSKSRDKEIKTSE